MKEGWVRKTIGEISIVSYGFTGKAELEGDYRYVRITDIDDNGELDSNEKKYIKHSNESDKFHLHDNDLLMARTGATYAKVLLYKDIEPSIFASYLIRIKFNEKIENKLYWYFSKSEDYWEQANQLSSGSAQPHFNGSALKKLVFTYPVDINEQKQIVAILDQAFAAIDQAQANLQKNIENAQNLFQSKLNQIFSHPSTSSGNDQSINSIKNMEDKTTEPVEVWEEKSLGEICENLDSKRKPITKNKRIKGKIPYYGASGIVDYVEDYIFDEDLLLVSEDGANLLARTYPIAFSISGKSWVNNHAHVLRFGNKYSQYFVEYYLNSIKLDEYISGMAQPKLNQKKLNSIKIPYPSAEVQESTVKKLKSLNILKVDLMESYQEKLNGLDELKKSILQKAFSGELTS